MNVLLRVLGLNLLAHVGSRLPSRMARTITSIVLIAANLLPLWAVLTGAAGVGEVFVVYWFENVVVWFTTTIKILTARGAAGDNAKPTSNALTAAFFAFHFGMFTLIHGLFSFTLVALTGGFTGEPRTWFLLLVAILVSHLVSLGLNWFGQGEREVVSARRAMALPYPRMVVLHVSVIGGFFLLFGLVRPDSTFDEVAPVALLCGLKTVVDAFFHVRERLANRRALEPPSEQGGTLER